MNSVEYIPNAKVPIVRFCDPILCVNMKILIFYYVKFKLILFSIVNHRKLACDVNINNTAGIYNTQLIRSYVEIDKRVRPLVMIIKYWARQRGLNNAGTCCQL